jgi:hypothetical protein
VPPATSDGQQTHVN